MTTPLLAAFVILTAGCSPGPYVPGPDGDYDAGGSNPFGDASLPDPLVAPMPPDLRAPPGLLAATEDAGEPPPDSAPPPVDAGPPDTGPPPVDSGPPPPEDAGFDAGYDSGSDAGYDAGPPPCTDDAWEPNESESTAALIASPTTPSWTGIIDPSWSRPEGDTDWYRLNLSGRVEGDGTRVTASTGSAARGWVRVRVYCDVTRCAGICGEPGTEDCGSRSFCERVALGAISVSVECRGLVSPSHATVEVTPSSLALCRHRVDFNVAPF